MISTRVVASFVAAAGVFAAGFGGASDSVVEAQATASVRAVHVGIGAPPVDIALDGQRAFAGLAFKAATDYQAIPARRAKMTVTPAGQGQAAVIDTDIELTAGQQFTVVVTGEAPSFNALVLSDNNSPPPAGQAKVRFVHGAPDVPPVDVTQGDRVLFDNVAFRGVGGYVNVPAGTYTLQMRPDNQSDVLFTVPNVTLTAGQIVTLFAAGKAADNTLAAVPVIYPVSGTGAAAGGGAAPTAPRAGLGVTGKQSAVLLPAMLTLFALIAGAAGARLATRRSL